MLLKLSRLEKVIGGCMDSWMSGSKNSSMDCLQQLINKQTRSDPRLITKI
jgi:hypothetical protein